ncbi:ABC transporter substrate-binding protein, partial [Bacteroidales bacterium OttesenSCG-928-E04]|nr:ABC transporter substrate-binding protein [Bacteroidales bacterium OttesenSCG-928-E04]
FSQTVRQKNILYLIPFYTDHLADINVAAIENDDQLDSKLPFQLTGFWNGSKIALEEFYNDSVHVNVIVKDITDNVSKLRNIMEDKKFMSTIDLIIGPFYSSSFIIAAEYAKKYEIPIVNPFSNRRDILENNEFVYKATPPTSIEPQLFYDRIIATDRDANIILWSDDEASDRYKNYEKLFEEQDLEPTKLYFDDNLNSFKQLLSPYRQNVVILLSNSTAKIISNFRQLDAIADLQDFLLLIPEKWIEEIYSELEVFNALQAYCFANNHVDYTNEKVVFFMTEYVERFNAPPTLEHFVFQGYDLTRYFLQALLHNFDHEKITIEPLAMDFKFVKIKTNGYENQQKRLLKFDDFEMREIK